MGTNGFFGFQKNGVIKGVFNQFDSYYEGLGIALAKKMVCLTKRERADFFEKKLVFIPESEAKTNKKEIHASDLLKLNWKDTRKKVRVVDFSHFTKRLGACPFAYIYDLDEGEFYVTTSHCLGFQFGDYKNPKDIEEYIPHLSINRYY